MAYRGRFAPSPTGPLHAGSVVAALASWLDARAHGGRWLVRIEDVDRPRCAAGADRVILGQLAALGLHPDEPPVWQSQRTARYEHALQGLAERGLAYRCTCTRAMVAAALAASGRERRRDEELAYPGTCRGGPSRPGAAAAWRLRLDAIESACQVTRWVDRRLGAQQQDVQHAVGDFVLRRADGLWAYQLAVVVDDAAQCITDIVRGEDLADNTPRQILLQRALGLPHPRCLHTPLVRAADGHKLSKQHGAAAVPTATPAQALEALRAAGAVLGLASPARDHDSWLAETTARWRERW